MMDTKTNYFISQMPLSIMDFIHENGEEREFTWRTEEDVIAVSESAATKGVWTV